MAVAASLVRNGDVYEITYDNSTGDGIVTATFENQADGDKSATRAIDDGSFLVHVDSGFAGTDQVTVTKDGATIDEGEVTFGS